MSEHPNVDLLRRGYDAYAEGDLDTLDKLFHDDLVWHVAGRSPISGDYRGKEEVIGYFGKLAELSDGTAKIEVHDFLADDEHGVAIVRELATRNGSDHRGMATHVFHLSDGQVTEMWDAQVDQQSKDEFWS